jgi:hypothetical protein
MAGGFGELSTKPTALHQTLSVEAKKPAQLELTLDLPLTGERPLRNVRCALVVYDRELYRDSVLGRVEMGRPVLGRLFGGDSDKAMTAEEWRPFRKVFHQIEDKDALNPPIGSGTGVLLKRELVLDVVDETHDGRRLAFWYVKEVFHSGQDLKGPFENTDRPYTIDLRMRMPDDATTPITAAMKKKTGPALPPMKSIGPIGYPLADFKDTAKSPARFLLIRLVCLQETPYANLKKGTVVLSNACPENNRTGAIDGLKLTDSGVSRNLTVGGDGGQHRHEVESTSRLLPNDLSGYWEPTAHPDCYAPFHLWISQVGHQRVGWFGPTGVPQQPMTGPDGKDRWAPPIAGLPIADPVMTRTYLRGVFLTDPAAPTPGTVTKIRWFKGKDRDPTDEKWFVADGQPGSIVIAGPNLIHVQFVPDGAFVPFRRLYQKLRRSNADLTLFERTYAKNIPAEVLARDRQEMTAPAPGRLWEDVEAWIVGAKMQEAVDQFQKSALLGKADQDVAALLAAKVLGSAWSNVPKALEPEARKRIIAIAMSTTMKAANSDVTKTVHDWLVEMVTHQADREGTSDPIEQRYLRLVSDEYQRVGIHPTGDYEYDIEFATAGGEVKALVGFNAGVFQVTITKRNHQGGTPTEVWKSPTWYGGYFGIGAGLAAGGGIGGKGSGEQQATGAPVSCKIRSAVDLSMDDWKNATFNLTAVAKPGFQITAFFEGTFGSSACIQFILDDKPHLRLSAEVQMPPGIGPKRPEQLDKDMLKGLLSAKFVLFSVTNTEGWIRPSLPQADKPPTKDAPPPPDSPTLAKEHGASVHLSFHKGTAQLQESGVYDLDVDLATYRALLDTPGKLSILGYTSPEGIDKYNLELSERRVQRAHDEVLNACGTLGAVMPKNKKLEPIAYGEGPARDPKLGNLKDPESISDRAEREKYLVDNERDFTRWRKVDLLIGGVVLTRLE